MNKEEESRVQEIMNEKGQNAVNEIVKKEKNRISKLKEKVNSKKEIRIKEYLIDLERRKSDAIVINGEGVGMKTPYNKPKTIAEASKLARELLNKKN